MNRRVFIAGLSCGVAWPIIFNHDACAQDAKPHRLGVILQGNPWYEVVDGLRDGLNRLGWMEGRDFVVDIRDTHGDRDAVEQAATVFERQRTGLIYSVATSVTLAVKRATATTPIVFVAGTDPVTTQLVQSLSRPSGRLTGVYVRATDLTGKRLEILRSIMPDLRRVVIFYDPSNRSAVEAAKEARRATQTLGLELTETHVASVEELHRVLKSFKVRQADAYFWRLGCDDRHRGSGNH